MATTKNTLASAGYIVTTGSTTTAPTFIHEAVVTDFKLSTNDHVTRPGVFTAGTPVEGTVSNPNNDSNN